MFSYGISFLLLCIFQTLFKGFGHVFEDRLDLERSRLVFFLESCFPVQFFPIWIWHIACEQAPQEKSITGRKGPCSQINGTLQSSCILLQSSQPSANSPRPLQERRRRRSWCRCRSACSIIGGFIQHLNGLVQCCNSFCHFIFGIKELVLLLFAQRLSRFYVLIQLFQFFFEVCSFTGEFYPAGFYISNVSLKFFNAATCS
mmetsp:Transcript_100975/g.200591  ORF Transcript_100975/g.200591 Transcript_100975/m.200591 type:complete len:201 (-) Transcript_100975:276-878(-)